jgi:glycosyltransferase involved in cell wall biosynthesis
MQRLTEAQLERPVICAPFIPVHTHKESVEMAEKKFDFIYVASGEPHKNHEALISAWDLLADEGMFPSLALTLKPEATPELCARLAERIKRRGLRIVNLGVISRDHLLEVYQQSDALIYPSSFESFGLPLIEARQVGLPVLAAELDYVRDVIDPNETFDPNSHISIARAVRRHLQSRKSDPVLYSTKLWLDHFLADNFQ